MSIETTSSKSSAYKYNARALRRLSLSDRLPDWFFEEFNLNRKNLHRQIDELTQATFEFQHRQDNQDFIDGKLGPGTLGVILADQKDRGGFLYRGDALGGRANVIQYKDPNGLDIHAVGHYTPRRFASTKPKSLVVHWGGLNPEHLYNCFSGARKVSSHAGIGLVGDEAVTYQYLDLQHKSWHAGFMNNQSIGIDICQQPSLKWGKYYTSRGYDVSIMENPIKGPVECLSLDGRILEQVGLVIEDLCIALDIPLVTLAPSASLTKKQAESFRGVLGHHHVSSRKWDCAPWWEEIANQCNLQFETLQDQRGS